MGKMEAQEILSQYQETLLLLGWLSTDWYREVAGTSILRDVQNQPEYSPGQPAVHGPAWRRVLGQIISGGPFNLKQSVILYRCIRVRY